MQKRGALELSISTIVVIVLAMTMLILGLVLVRSIFAGAKYNIDTINDKVRDEIGKLFTEDKKTVIYLANQKADIKQGESWGIAFGIQNLETGFTGDKKFHYVVEVSDPDIKKKCGINEATANSWISTGREDTLAIASGDKYVGLVRFQIPVGSPLCIIRYHLAVEFDDAVYATDFFDVEVKAK
mgnify:CR=1 FL=1